MTDQPNTSTPPVQSIATVCRIPPTELHAFETGQQAWIAVQRMPVEVVDFYADSVTAH